jgi:hypothetical protein
VIFAVAFIDYDGDNELVLEQVEAISECEAMAFVLDSQGFDPADFDIAVAENDEPRLQEIIDELSLNIEIRALAIE